eukprot:jgi/Psemu1/39455/gm1.39455_g
MFDKKGEADITLAEVLRYNKSTRLKNSEIEETSIKMTTPEKQKEKPEDDFQTVAIMQSIEEMKDCKKNNSIASIIEHISAKKYIPQMKGAESIFEVLETFCQYMRLKYWKLFAKKIKVENNTKDLANDVVGDKRGDKNEDETNQFFHANGDDSVIDNNEKVNDGRDEIKAPHRWNKACKSCADKKAKKKYEIHVRLPAKKRGRPLGSKNSNKRNSPNKKKLESRRGNLQLYSNSKQALKILLEIMGKEKLIDSEINLEDETPEQTLERIAASHNMTVEELLVENNILKDDNPDNLPDKKIEQLGRKKSNYKELTGAIAFRIRHGQTERKRNVGTNTRVVSLKEETKDPNQDGRLHRVLRSSNKQGKRAGRFS